MNETKFDLYAVEARQIEEPAVTLICMNDLKKLFQVRGKGAIQRIVKTPGFPKAIRLSQRTIRWNKAEVVAWIKEQTKKEA